MGFGSGPIRAQPGSVKGNKFGLRNSECGIEKWTRMKTTRQSHKQKFYIGHRCTQINTDFMGQRIKEKSPNGTRMNTDKHGYQEMAKDFSNPNQKEIFSLLSFP
jgi:hypothetical protein